MFEENKSSTPSSKGQPIPGTPQQPPVSPTPPPTPQEESTTPPATPPVTPPPTPSPDLNPPQGLKPDSFETPELAKKETIQKAEATSAEVGGEKIYTMPNKFKKMKPKLATGKKKNKLIILIILVVLLLAGGGLGYYFWTKNYYQVPEEETIVEEEVTTGEEPVLEETESGPPTEEEPLIEEEEPILSPEQTLGIEIEDELEGLTEVVNRVEFYLPLGAIDLDTQIDISGSLLSAEIKNEDPYQNSFYEIIGSIYTFEPADIIFNSTVTLRIFYHQKLIDEKWENDLTLGYLKNDLWTPLPSELDSENNILTISFEILPSATLAIMVNKEKLVPQVEEFQIAPDIPSSIDSDNDGLTDVEELIFSTEINNPDSDADTIPDGQEILALMHPLGGDQAKLATSGLINVYTNPTYSYSFFYPASWLARAIPETNNQEVLVITNTGEFFSITIENNPERLAPMEWYLKQSPSTDTNLLSETIVNNEPAVWNPSHLTLYITKEAKVYVLSYNIGTEKETNFKSIFEMMINSFQFVVQPQGRTSGTLIKYPDLPEVYLIENGKKRVFQSGDIFEKLGFKWENVIEIPLNETYADGDAITGRLDGTLIKYFDNPGIYLIKNGQKRAFQSGDIFEALGYKWDDIIEIPVDEIYPDGPIIEGNITSTPALR